MERKSLNPTLALWGHLTLILDVIFVLFTRSMYTSAGVSLGESKGLTHSIEGLYSTLEYTLIPLLRVINERGFLNGRL